ncbi:response regulator transcription factor [Conexibacter sp. SYSU D00693]|uniref:helix-turn-helix transcriptional regulator n=1 Tax=Conexibacter sp. SYSU D00693 TaxID=2812560 RepID=UPI00196AAB70|nr:response regulator transcription factor [Conexibacter sp. SYSU D00693]
MVQPVVVVSESYVLRTGLSRIGSTPPLEVVAELDDPAAVARVVRRKGARLVLAAPCAASGEQVLEELGELPAGCRALVLLPGAGYQVLAHATRRRRRDVVFLPLHSSPRQLRRALTQLLRATPRPAPAPIDEAFAGPAGVLTRREHEVLRALSQGLSNKAIAGQFVVSEDTVKTHLRKIYRKLGVNSRGEAIALYLGDVGTPPSLPAREPAAVAVNSR